MEVKLVIRGQFVIIFSSVQGDDYHSESLRAVTVETDKVPSQLSGMRVSG